MFADARGLIAALSVAGLVTTTQTLYAWWSSHDMTGPLMVGVIIAVPAVATAAPLLFVAGSRFGGPVICEPDFTR